MDHYAETTVKSFDQTPIWYRRIGTREPTLVLCDGVGCDGYVWKYLIPHFEHRQKIIHWNYRCHGKTPPPTDPEALGIEDCAQDLKAVLDDAGVRTPAVFIGHSMGVQVILEFYHRYPDRVCGLIPITGPYGKALDYFHDSMVAKQVFPFIKQLVTKYNPWFSKMWRRLVFSEIAYQYAVKFEVNEKLVKREDFFPYLEHLSRMDPLLFFHMVERAAKHTAESYLPDIKVPVLIIAGEQDKFTPYWIARRMHAMIPHSSLLTLPLGSHTGPIEHPELTNLKIEKFLSEIQGNP